MLKIVEVQPVPAALVVHGALIGAELCIGVGGIITKVSMRGANSLPFALSREVLAGLMLFVISGRQIPRPEDVRKVFTVGFLLFTGQLFFMLGLLLSDPVATATWQCSIPVFTTIVAVALGYEQYSYKQVLGLGLAVGGAVFMESGVGRAQTGLHAHLFFFIQCNANALYLLKTKQLLQKYSVASVTSWANLSASMFMFTATCIMNFTPELLTLVCDNPSSAVSASCAAGGWWLREFEFWPLVYWTLIGSVLSFYCLSFANQYAKASVVGVYTVLQPVTAGVLSVVLRLLMGNAWADGYDLHRIGVHDLGVLGIAAGLVVLFQEPTMQPPETRALMKAKAILEEC